MTEVVSRLAVELTLDAENFTASLDAALQRAQAFGSKLQRLGAVMSATITAPLAALGTAALRSAAQFEQNMNMLRQVAGATESDMALLQARALELGAVTAFSAGEAAEAMLELGKAGFNSAQIMESIGGVLDLAAAGGISLAEAAEVTANTLQSFNLQMSESARVANLLAAAANASSLDITDLAYGMKMSSAVYASYKQSVETLVTALALLANAGLKGSDAGTSLKTMLMRLAAPTDDAYEKLQELNVAVFDSAGNMRQLKNILADLGRATAKMTDEQRALTLTTLFGADAIRAANILLAAGTDGWEKMAAALDNGTAAADLANARMSGLAGAVEYLKGSVDSFLISTALPFLSTFSSLIIALADAISAFGQLPPRIRNVVLAVGGLAAIAGPALVAVGTAMTLAAPAVGALASAAAALATPVGLAAVALLALGAAVYFNAGGIRDKLAPAFGFAEQQAERLIETLSRFGITAPVVRLAEAFADAAVAAKNLTLAVLDGQLTVEQAGAALGFTFRKLRTEVAQELAELARAVADSVASLLPSFERGKESVLAFAKSFSIPAGLDAVVALAPRLGRLGGEFGRLAEQARNLAPAIGLLSPLLVALVPSLASVLAPVAGLIAALGGLAAAWDANLLGIRELAHTYLPALEEGLRALSDRLLGVPELPALDFSSILVSLPALEQFGGVLASWQIALPALGTSFDNLAGAGGRLGAALLELAATTSTALSPYVWAAANIAISALAGTLAALPAVLNGLIQSLTIVTERLAAFVEKLAVAVAALAAGDFSAAVAAMGSALAELAIMLDEVVGNALAAALAAFGEFASVLAGGLETVGLSAVAGALEEISSHVSALAERLATMTLSQALMELLAFAWPELPALPEWIERLLAWRWPAMPAMPGWLNSLLSFRWPELPQAPRWLTDLLSFRWPELPAMPGWLGSMFGGNSPTPRGALGRSNWRGGEILVGETGPELVTLPPGSRIFPAGRTERLLQPERSVVVNVSASVQSELDMQLLARRIVRELQAMGV